MNRFSVDSASGQSINNHSLQFSNLGELDIFNEYGDESLLALKDAQRAMADDDPLFDDTQELSMYADEDTVLDVYQERWDDLELMDFEKN